MANPTGFGVHKDTMSPTIVLLSDLASLCYERDRMRSLGNFVGAAMLLSLFVRTGRTWRPVRRWTPKMSLFLESLQHWREQGKLRLSDYGGVRYVYSGARSVLAGWWRPNRLIGWLVSACHLGFPNLFGTGVQSYTAEAEKLKQGRMDSDELNWTGWRGACLGRTPSNLTWARTNFPFLYICTECPVGALLNEIKIVCELRVTWSFVQMKQYKYTMCSKDNSLFLHSFHYDRYIPSMLVHGFMLMSVGFTSRQELK
jgi:hypothetical protein